jgi:cyclopropane fatty-acyl-phospholipid synthase-like methyltransferase
MTVELPYFDDLFERLAKAGGDSPITRVFQRHLHWGFFAQPQPADLSDAAFLVGAEAMTERVCQSARVKDGMRILEVGCGLGGTISHMNDRLSGCEFVGLNIDARQVAFAREHVAARPTNSVRFVVGDACAPPFEPGSFDLVLAMECIFHFPSRRTFLAEARRVLRPGGRLTISDFIVDSAKFDEMSEWMEANPTAQGSFFGSITPAISSNTYDRLGRTKHLTLAADEDISAETMPTYPWLERLYRKEGMAEGVKTVVFLEEMARRGFFQYRILSFEATS